MATLGGHIETWGTSPHSSAFYEDQSTQIVALKVVLPTGEIVQTGSSAVTTAGILCQTVLPLRSDRTVYRRGKRLRHRYRGHPEDASVARSQPDEDGGIQGSETGSGHLAQDPGGTEERKSQHPLGTAPDAEGHILLAVPRLADSLARPTRYMICFRGEGECGEVESHMARTCGIAQAEGGRVLDDPVPEWWEGRHGLFPELVLSKGPRIMLVAITPMGRYEEACKLAERFGHEHRLDISLIEYPLGGPVMLAHVVIRFEGATSRARERTLSLARKLMEGLMELGCVPHRVGTDFLPVLIKNTRSFLLRIGEKNQETPRPEGHHETGCRGARTNKWNLLTESDATSLLRLCRNHLKAEGETSLGFTKFY